MLDRISYFVGHFDVAQCQTSKQPASDLSLNVDSVPMELWEGDETAPISKT